jgi:hypothetical protein
MLLFYFVICSKKEKTRIRKFQGTKVPPCSVLIFSCPALSFLQGRTKIKNLAPPCPVDISGVNDAR